MASDKASHRPGGTGQLEQDMNGFNVFYVKEGRSVSVFAATEREAKHLMLDALRDPACSGIGVRPAA